MFQVSRCVSSLIFSFALVTCFAVTSALTTTPADASVPMSPQKKGKESKKEKTSKNESATAISQPSANSGSSKGKGARKESAAPTKAGVPSLWEDRGDISKLNLFMGIGSEAGLPKPPFKFDKEDVISNWDAKPTNNNVLGMYDGQGRVKDWYLVADWGGTFGKTGGFMSHTKWDLADYSKQQFIQGSKGNAINFHYSGKMSAMRSIPIDHARWFIGILGQLSDNQIRDAFRAAGATQSETDGFSAQIRKRISELKAAAR